MLPFVVATMTPLERGLAVGNHVLVRSERVGEDEQVWLARTATLPPSPMTARLRPRAGAGQPSPFGQELQLGKWLQHPNVEAAIEESELGTWACAISTGAPGVPLPDLLDALAAMRARDEAQWSAVVAHVVASVLSGLDVAHRATGAPGRPKGIVHGAVRPAAITVDAGGLVKLGGFGASLDDDPSRAAERSFDALAYAAPEQLGTRGRVGTMDLWSVGAVLHELLDGRKFRGELTDVRVLYRVALAGDVPVLARPAPEGLERMRQWLLAKQPRDRPRSAADALQAMGASAPGVADVLGSIVRAQQGGAVAPPVEALPQPVVQPQPQPVAMPRPMPQQFAMPQPVAMPQPALAPPPFARLPIPEEEGTVELSEAVLAAMRGGTAPPQSPRAAPARAELQMPPPAARSSSHSAPPPSRAPQQAFAPQPAPAPRPAPAPYPSPMHPAAMPAHAAPPRSVVVRNDPHHRDPGPLELSPTYEPTTTTMIRARKSTRNFTLLIIAAGLVAIVVGVGVGYLIIDDGTAPPKAAPKH